MIRTLVFYLLFSVSYATTCSQLKTLYSDLTCCGNPTVDTCLRTIPLCASATNGEICTDTSDHAIIKGGVTATIPTASTTVLGGVKVDGSSIIIANGIISAPIGSSSSSTSSYTLPTATQNQLGGVKVDGTTIKITADGVISQDYVYTLPTASTTVLGGVKVDGTTITIDPTTGEISQSYVYTLPTASTTVLGGVKVDGTTITIDPTTGEISQSYVYTLPTADENTLGGVKVDGTTITVDVDGTITSMAVYTLPQASTTVLGGIMVDGTSITIDANGKISAVGGGSTAFSGDYNDLTNKPDLSNAGGSSAGSSSSSSGVQKNGQLLDIVAGVADGRTVKGAEGDYTLENVIAQQHITNTHTGAYDDVTGSKITYKPPAGTTEVIYKFRYHMKYNADTSIYEGQQLKLFLGGTQCGLLKHTDNHNYGDTWVEFEWIIQIGIDDMPNGKISSWTDLKEIKLGMIEQSSTKQAIIHGSEYSEHEFGGDADAVIQPELEVRAIGLGGAGGGVAVDNLTIKQHADGTIYVANSAAAAVTSDGQVLEELIGVCDGSAVTVESGTYTLADVTAKQTTTATFSTLTGSDISYKPPTGTTQVIYQFSAVKSAPSNGVEHMFVNTRLMIDNSPVSNLAPSIGKAVSAHHGETITFKYVVEVGTEDIANGHVATWNSAKSLRLEVQQAGGPSYNGYVAQYRYSGYCSSSLEIRVYDGSSDNPGTTEEQYQRCLEGCVDKITPTSGTWWSADALSFHILNGRCYCMPQTWLDCTTPTSHSTYVTYDIAPYTIDFHRKASSTDIIKPILNIRAIGKESNYYVLPNTLVTLAGVLQVDGPNLGLGISPTAPLHVGTGASTSISTSRFECDGSGAIIEQANGEVETVMTYAQCSTLPNFEFGVAQPATTATKTTDAICLSVHNSPYNFNPVIITSGSPDFSMTEEECQIWAEVDSDSYWDGASSWSHIPSGCVASLSDGKHHYNRQNSGSGTANAICGSGTYECVQKLNTKIQSNQQQPVSNDMLTSAECNAYALSIDKTFSTISESGANPKGCFDQGGTIVYFNSANSAGICGNQYNSDCVMKETKYDNPGTPNDQHRVNACRDACANRDSPLFSGSWTFRSASFWVEPTGGQCFCGEISSTACTQQASTFYELYELQNKPQGCYKDSSTGEHYHNTPTDDNYGPCSAKYPCLRTGGCLVQDTTTETKELSIISEKSAWFKQEVVISSDRRIKENIVDVEHAREKMRLIAARNYSYIDKRKHNGTTVGFIAQEVKEVMPEAVKVEKGFVPNLLKRVSCSFAWNVTLKMTCAELASGRVRLFVTNKGGESLLDVEVTDGVMEVEEVYTVVYAFGYEVEDFHTLEKSKLFALNFAATKELDQEVQLLRQEMDAIKQAVGI